MIQPFKAVAVNGKIDWVPCNPGDKAYTIRELIEEIKRQKGEVYNAQ